MYIHSHTAEQLFLSSHVLALALLRKTENKCYLVRGYVAAVTIPIVETAEAVIAGAPSEGQFAPRGLPNHTNFSQTFTRIHT